MFASCNAQAQSVDKSTEQSNTFTYVNFETEVLAFEPSQNKLDKQVFDKAVFILNEVKTAVKNDNNAFNRADYFNLLRVFLELEEPTAHIDIAWQKFRDADESCEYFAKHGLFKSDLYEPIRSEIKAQQKKCEANYIAPVTLDLKAYASKNKLNYDLVVMLDEINKADQKYRKDDETDWKAQGYLDKLNQHRIDSLFTHYTTYIGTSLVGEEYAQVMWLVIQHSNLKMMEQYLPAVHKAYQAGEVDAVPLKMLIDRIYAIKKNEQIFGSQEGVVLATEMEREEVKRMYNLK